MEEELFGTNQSSAANSPARLRARQADDQLEEEIQVLGVTVNRMRDEEEEEEEEEDDDDKEEEEEDEHGEEEEEEEEEVFFEHDSPGDNRKRGPDGILRRVK
jgi:hypothetical protein